MFFHEGNMARSRPQEEAAHHEISSEKSTAPAPEQRTYLANLTEEAFQSQTDPRKKQEMLIAMITELGNEERSRSARDKLLKIVVDILNRVDESTPENMILMQARARREDPTGQLIDSLPNPYRTTVDTAYMTARYYVRSPKKKLGLRAGEHTVKTFQPPETKDASDKK